MINRFLKLYSFANTLAFDLQTGATPFGLNFRKQFLLNNICKFYRDDKGREGIVVKNFNPEIQDRKFMVFLGPLSLRITYHFGQFEPIVKNADRWAFRPPFD